MGRKNRLSAPGTIYHVIARGNNREPIFLSEKDYAAYLGIWRKYSQKLEFEVYSYVLMTNHVHWLIRTGRSPISSILHTTHGLYARHFNQIHGRVGHVFQGRFKSEICKDDRYLFALIRYIHRNPIEAGIVNNLRDYPWSSYLDILGIRNDPLVKPEFVTGLFPGAKSKSSFLQWVEGEGYDEEYFTETSNLAHQPIRLETKESVPGLESIAESACAVFNITINDLQGDSRKIKIVQARRMFIREAVIKHAYKRSDVARFLVKDRSLITKVLL